MRFRISGHSMLPALKPDQQALVSSLPYLFSQPAVNDLITFRDQDKYIIKRISKIKNHKYYVAGDNKIDSKDYGWLERSRIIGKVIYIYA